MLNRSSYWLGVLLVGLLCWPAVTYAHVFERAVVYVPPIPFWMYWWGGVAALLTSFLVTAFFLSKTPTSSAASGTDLTGSGWHRVLRSSKLLWVGLGLVALMGCIVLGRSDVVQPGYANKNPSMVLFWVVFVLGMVYVSALLGNVYVWLNPWRNVFYGLSLCHQRFWRGWLPYPRFLGYWPAVWLYLVFIAWELQFLTWHNPETLAQWLLAYTVVNGVGAVLFGGRVWFTYVELFSVLFRLVALVAPLQYEPATPGNRGKLRLVWPGVGLLRAAEEPDDSPNVPVLSGRLIGFISRWGQASQAFSLIVFILFMLSSTVFDGLHETVLWRQWYGFDYSQAYNGVMGALGYHILHDYNVIANGFTYWQYAWLAGFLVLYIIIYAIFIALSRWLGGGEYTVLQLMLKFSYSLIPIAVVYNITHYLVVVLTRGVKIFSMLSDPLVTGADYLGTKYWFYAVDEINVDAIWHTQVVLIVFGHIISVVLAHYIAMQCFPNRWRAVLSQLPMLLLMMAFTVAGLWVLTLPLQG